MPDPTLTQKCTNWAKFFYGDYVLVNNAWGVAPPRPPRSDWTQCIYNGTVGGQIRNQWTWNWPSIGSNDVYAYPEVIFGWKPFDADTTTTKLPRQLSTISSIPTTYEIEIAAGTSGVYNTAFDLWLTSGATPSSSTITSEVMIWVDQKGLQPAGVPIATVPATFGSFTLYKSTFPGWIYYAFVLDTTLLAATIDLNGLLQYMVNQGHASPNEYLASIEFGNEISSGTGEADLKQFSVDVV